MNLIVNARRLHTIAIVLSSLAFIAVDAQAQGHHSGGGAARGGAGPSHAGAPGGFAHGGRFGPGHGFRHGPGWGPGWGWGGVGLGFGLGWGFSNYYYDGYPAYVVVPQGPVVYGTVQPVPLTGSQATTQMPAPVIYPRNGQDAAQIDSDSNQCSEWAGKQPSATTDPGVFRRAVEACMDARGYTLR